MVNNFSVFKIWWMCSFMCLIIEFFVFEMILVNILLFLEELIIDDNIWKKKIGWWIFKLLVYKMCVGCILGVVLFKVFFGRDILMEIVFNVEY